MKEKYKNRIVGSGTVNPADLRMNPLNWRKHPKEQSKALDDALSRLGWIQDVIVNKTTGHLIDGHLRVETALKNKESEIPVKYVELTEEEEKIALATFDPLTLMAEQDDAMLKKLLEGCGADVDLSQYHDDYDKLMRVEHTAEELEAVPEVPKVAKTKRGDVYKLGEHVLMCGDSTSEADVAKLMHGEKADMVFTDPPYGMGKASEGVINDNLYNDNLLAFNQQWIPLSFSVLSDNGSWYCWGIDEPLMDIYSNILKPMIKDNKLTFRNLITWDKGSGRGQLSDTHRSYPRADEKCLFCMMGVQGFNTNADNYFEKWEPIRQYLVKSRELMGWDEEDIRRITGVTTVGRHCFSRSQWEFPTEEHYKAMQSSARGDAFKREYDDIKREYDDIKREYDDIKREYYATRAYFDNTHENMNNVWHDQYMNSQMKEKEGITHTTPKPLTLCKRAVISSSMEGWIVLDMFGGSGSTLIACEETGRKCRMMELAPEYCDVIVERWEKLTGKHAELIREGENNNAN